MSIVRRANRKKVEGRAGNHATDVPYLEMGNACNECHGPGYDTMLHHWRQLLAEAEIDATKRLVAAEDALFKHKSETGGGTFQEAARLVDDARHNLEFVKVGKGHHNVEYALKALHVSRSRASEALGLLAKTASGGDIPALELTCTTLCHTEMESREVRLGSINYPHKKHVVDLGFQCTDCHGDSQHHGDTRLENCNSCHHGKGEGKVGCSDCHREVAALRIGQGAFRIEGPADSMKDLECANCHTQTTEARRPAPTG